jgi:hypothetical protein
MNDAIMGKMPVTFKIGTSGKVVAMQFPLASADWVKR